MYADRDFDIVFDWTAFAAGSQVPVNWLKTAYGLIPVDLRDRFKTARMLTPNALALRYMRRLYNLTGGRCAFYLAEFHLTPDNRDSPL